VGSSRRGRPRGGGGVYADTEEEAINNYVNCAAGVSSFGRPIYTLVNGDTRLDVRKLVDFIRLKDKPGMPLIGAINPYYFHEIAIRGVGYGSQTQSFEITLFVFDGIKNAAKKSDSVLEIVIGIPSEDIRLVQTFGGPLRVDKSGEMKVAFQWDRSLGHGRTADGLLDIITGARILKPDGAAIAVAEPLTTTVKIRTAE